MRAGILTFHNVTNYGAALQCFALQRLCRELLPGGSVEVINYQPSGATEFYLRRHLLKRREIAYLGRMAAFHSFSKKHFDLSGRPLRKREQLRALADRYDVLIVGSDEVWKIDNIRGWDSSYFLDFANSAKTRLVSYAASSDINTSYQEVAAEISAMLERFACISVRDRHTQEKISALVHRPVTQVLDPTLVSDFSGIHLEKRVCDEPYILVYARMNAKGMKRIREEARKRRCKVISVGHKNEYAHRNLLAAGPMRWLDLIRHAELVVSNYYHGILLSIKYRKPLIPLFSKGKRAKIGDIAEKLHFSQTVRASFPDDVPDDLFDCVVDYSACDAFLEEEVARSLSFLKGALGK